MAPGLETRGSRFVRRIGIVMYMDTLGGAEDIMLLYIPS